MRTREDLDKMLKKGIEMLKESNIPISKSICPNIRLFRSHRRFGQCCGPLSSKNKTSYAFVIEISEYVLQMSERAMMNTILHELLHTCPDCMNHGPTWRAYAAVAKTDWGYNIRRIIGDKEKKDLEMLREGFKRKDYQYIITCPSCGTVWKRRINSTFVQRAELYTCSRCKVHLKRIQ